MSEPLLAGAVVQRVDVGPRAAVLRVRAPGETRFVIVAAGAVGVLAERPWKGAGLPGGSAPEGEKTRLRARLEGARVEAIEARRILLRKGDARIALEAGAGEGARIALREVPDEEAIGDDAARARDEEAWLAEGARIARELGESALATRRQDLARALGRAIARVERRIAAIRGDLERIGEADALAARATAFVAEAARAPRGAAKLTTTDWSSGEPRAMELAIDPARPAREQIDAMFKRARRLKLGAAIARRRLDEAGAAVAGLDAAAARLGEAATLAAVEALAVQARAAAPRDFALAAGAGGAAPRAAKAAPSRPFRAFHGAGGERILVGRGAAHNDALTFHAARPHDLWLHAKGRAGAHVIVPLAKSHACPSDLLVDAAHLAAHFSDAREEAIVEVEHTPRRYLRKPRGLAPGFVVVDREKVIVLRVDRERTARLLAAEEP